VELVHYIRVVRRRWLIVLVAVLSCAGVAYLLSSLRTPVYRAETRLVVSAPAGGGANDELSNRTLAISRATAYASYAPTTPAVDAALEGAGYPTGGSRPQVTATADGSTPFLLISVQDSDPQRAAKVANAYVQRLLGVVARLDGTRDVSSQRLAVIDPAGVPSRPDSPRPVRDAGIGLVLGLILGLGAAFVRESLDRTYVDPDVLETTTNLPVLGVVPQALEKVDLPSISQPSSGRAEAYRTVRTNLSFAGGPDTTRRLVVTSATPGEGKTSVSANVAVALASAGHSVVLVDADLRRPRVASVFGLQDEGPGLVGLLTGDLDVQAAIRTVDEAGLAVIPAGGTLANPSEMLGSERMQAVLEELEQQYETVLIDTPPVLPVTDALVLSAGASGVVVVVRLGETSRERLDRALSSLRKLDVPVLGLVANGAVASGDAAYGYGSKYGYEKRVASPR